MWGSSLWLSIALLSLGTRALQVTPGSECEALCLDGANSTLSDSKTSNTNSSDITCIDDDFFSTGKGIKFRNCVTCLQRSKATWEDESDVFWFLYNIRYAFDVCLYSYPGVPASGAINTPCNIDGACASLKGALETSLKNVGNDTQFDYCKADNGAVTGAGYKECISCLRSTSSQTYLVNFLVALKAGCDQEPDAGDLIGLSGQLFTSTKVNITDPNTNTTLPGDGGAPSGAMTTGTIVGIAVGIGLFALSGVAFLFIYCRRRRQGGMKIESPPPNPPMNGGHYQGIRKDSYFPDHKRSASHQGQPYTHARGGSNAEYYDKLEEHIQQNMLGVNYHYAPNSKSNGPNGAIPAHPAYLPRVASKIVDQRRNSPPPIAIVKPNIPDSYALQTYLAAAEESGINPKHVESTESSLHSRSGSRQSEAEAMQLPPPPPPPVVRKSKVPSLIFPSISKIKIPRKYTPPQVTVQDATPVDENTHNMREMRISAPLAVLDPNSRFHDRPLGSGPVLATEAPAGFQRNFSRNGRHASPLLSDASNGSSRIYG